MANRIQLRRDTAANWSSNNPTLASGEVSFVTDENKVKIGDGVTAWTSLSYVSLTPTEIQTAIDNAVSGLVDSAPGVLDTLNEIAAAINDDPNFFTTVATNLSNHEADTTNIHGIADTSLLATTSYVDTAESDAVSTANAYADSLASNYDAAGSASAVASDLSDHELATTSVHGISDTSALETQTGAQSKADTAESNAVATANAYSDSLASNYDAAGSASAVASDLTDHENSTTNVHGIVDTSALATKTYADNAAATAAANLVDSAPTTLDTLNELAAALGDDPNFATTVTDALGNKQPLDADLTAIAGLVGTSGFLKKTAADTWSLDTNTYITGNETITLTGDVSGSGTTSISVTVADDSHNHIISNVDGLQTELDAKAPLASPALTGAPTAPTASAGTNSTQIATTAYVDTATAAVQPTIHPMFIIGGV